MINTNKTKKLREVGEVGFLVKFGAVIALSILLMGLHHSPHEVLDVFLFLFVTLSSTTCKFDCYALVN